MSPADCWWHCSAILTGARLPLPSVPVRCAVARGIPRGQVPAGRGGTSRVYRVSNQGWRWFVWCTAADVPPSSHVCHVQEEPRGVKRPRDEEAPLEGLSSLTIQGPAGSTERDPPRPRSSLAAPSPAGSPQQQRARPGSGGSRVGNAGRRSRSPSGARSGRPATSPQGRPGSCRGDSRERDRGRRGRRWVPQPPPNCYACPWPQDISGTA